MKSQLRYLEKPRATLQIGANASAQEVFAAEEIQTFYPTISQGAKLDIRTNRQQTETHSSDCVGALQNQIRQLQDYKQTQDSYWEKRAWRTKANRIKTIEVGTEIVIVVACTHWKRRYLRCVRLHRKLYYSIDRLDPRSILRVGRVAKSASPPCTVYGRNIGSILSRARSVLENRGSRIGLGAVIVLI